MDRGIMMMHQEYWIIVQVLMICIKIIQIDFIKTVLNNFILSKQA